MSFLSRKPARPSGRDGSAGRDDDYDDYDGYTHDAYQNEDEGWSPNEYFSPEGIKGRWAGQHPDGRAGGRAQVDGGRGQRDGGPGPEYGDEYSGAEYGGAPGYGADEFATGVYDLPDGADGDRSDRSRRRRRDREDRGERTGILRLRRDRGEDIWPDDGISDEDYWASVAADRPLTGADSPLDNFPGTPGGNGPRPGPDGRPGMGGADSSRFGGEQRGAERGVTGRLGPPPGLGGDYKPAAAGNSGPMRVGAGAGQPGGSGRASSGPMPARQGTGPQPARPGTGPTPTVGVTSSRPPAGQSGARPGPAKPGPGANGFSQPAARPSFQPNGYQPAGYQASGPAGGRPQDRGDWGDRTERIDRVNAAGYPDQRPSGRGQGPGTLGASGYQPAPTGTPSFTASPGRGRADNGRPESGRQDNARADNAAWQAPGRRDPGRRDHGRDNGREVNGRETSGGWPTQARGASPARGGGEDDPLTSKAYSRSAQAETDGRSYRVAARRSQAQTKLTDQAETFITGHYQQSSQYQSGRTGEYWYRDDAPTTISQATAGRYPAPVGQGTGTSGAGTQGPGTHGGHAAQPARSQASPARGQLPANGGQPGMPGHNGGRAGSSLPSTSIPGAGLPGGQYDGQQARPAQPQRPPQHRQPQHRQPQPQLPSAALPAANPPTAGAPGGGYAGGGAPTGSIGAGGAMSNGAAGTRPTAAGGQNPYDSGVTGSYPYSNQTYNGRQATSGPAQGGPAQGGTDDRYYRPAPADGYGAGQNGGSHGPGGQGRADQGRNGYANGYPANGDRRY